MSNKTGKGGFTKGDPRINRKGRPKTFDQVRALFQQLGNEVAIDKHGNPVVINGHVATIAEMVIRQVWREDAKTALAYAYGKVPDDVNLKGGLGISLTPEIKGVDYRTVAAVLAPRPVQDSDEPGEGENTLDGSPVG